GFDMGRDLRPNAAIALKIAQAIDARRAADLEPAYPSVLGLPRIDQITERSALLHGQNGHAAHLRLDRYTRHFHEAFAQYGRRRYAGQRFEMRRDIDIAVFRIMLPVVIRRRLEQLFGLLLAVSQSRLCVQLRRMILRQTAIAEESAILVEH